MIPYLPTDHWVDFPDTDTALREPDVNGLLCAGGDLAPQRLWRAYQRGIFPWYSTGEPILWWSPDPRAVIFAEEIHISRSTRRTLNQGVFEIRHNTAFAQVMAACAAPRAQQQDTWILPEMIAAYTELHRLGHAHSYECWHDGQLVGGVYGIRVNSVFCGESMFSAMSNASKVALIHITRQPEYALIDCQILNPHLQSLGARTLPRRQFLQWLTPHPDTAKDTPC